jgi:hypothetical protein
MRWILWLAVAANLFSAIRVGAQDVTYCRVYRTMTLGENVACYYCLKCPNCQGPAQGFLGSWTEEVGSCTTCGTNCFNITKDGMLVPAATKSDDGTKKPAAATLLKPTNKDPEILHDPEITKDLKRWYVNLEITGGATVKLFVATATITPEKDNGDFYDPLTTGFGRFSRSKVQAHADATNIRHLGGPIYRFDFTVGGTSYRDCMAVVDGP